MKSSASAPVFATVLLSAVLTVVPAFVLGRASEREGRFLKSYRAPDWAEGHLVVQMNYVTASTEANDILFLGESTTTVGIETLEIERLTGRRAYNLAVPGILGIDGLIVLLRCYLRNHPPPKMVVFSAHPLHYLLGAPGWLELRERFFRAYGQCGGAREEVQDRSPMWLVGEGIRVVAGRAQGGEKRFLSVRNPVLGSTSFYDWEEKVHQQRGFFEKPGKIPIQVRLEPSDYPIFSVVPWYGARLDEMAELLRTTGSLLVVRPMPLMRRMHQEDSHGLVQWLAGFERRHENVVVVRPEIVVMDGESFSDPVHLSRDGARDFSRRLAAELIAVDGERPRP